MEIIANIFMVAVTLILPVGAGIWLAVKRKGYLKPILLGVVCFGFFQVATRIPALYFLGRTVWYSVFSTTQPFMNALFLAVTAGLFEEGGRWIVMSLFMKDRRRLGDGLAFGVGHGGLEAVLLVGVNSVVLLIMNDYSATTPLQLFAGGFERICALTVQMALSVMVLKSVALKKPLWLLLAFAIHTVIDLAAILLPQAGASTFIIEAAVLVFSLLLLGYIVIENNTYKGGEFLCQTTEN